MKEIEAKNVTEHANGREEVSPLVELTLCHQREALSKQVSFALVYDASKLGPTTLEYRNLLDVGEIPYNFKLGSILKVEHMLACTREYLIPSSFYC